MPLFLNIDIGWVPPIALGSDFLRLHANVSYRTLCLALCLVGMHSTVASEWALRKFSYSSLGVGVSDIS